MAAFNLSLTLAGNTRPRTGTASAGDITRFVAACRAKYNAVDDNSAVDAFLNDCVKLARQITRDHETAAAVVANVDSIQNIVVT